MHPRVTETILVTGAVAYLAAFGWALVNLSYDIWGALVIVPVLAVLGVLALRRMFAGDLRPVGTIMIVGLFLKFGGAAARYWVGFEAYGGGIDAQRYHEYARDKAGAVWNGTSDVFSLLPSGTGTPFMEDLTAIVYTVVGSSKLGAFMVFSWLAYLGTAWFVKAACVAIPGLRQRRYAVLCVLAPSIVYWPSSIGKEAWMFLVLGFTTYGIARLLAGRGRLVPITIGVVGLLGAAAIRPHMAGLWIAGLLPALVVALFVRQSGHQRRGRGGERLGLVVLIVLAAIGLSIAAGATLRYLDFQDETGEVSVTSIIDETARRTQQAGSNFVPPSVDSPANWPYAFVRTVTRPLLIEARGAGQLLSALEITVLLGVAALSLRRLTNLPRLLVRVPFVAFAMTTLFFGTLAFTSFANLGVLTRQRTLLFPFLLLVLCLPTRRETVELAEAEAEERARENERLALEAVQEVYREPALVPAGWRVEALMGPPTGSAGGSSGGAVGGGSWRGGSSTGPVGRASADPVAGGSWRGGSSTGPVAPPTGWVSSTLPPPTAPTTPGGSSTGPPVEMPPPVGEPRDSDSPWSSHSVAPPVEPSRAGDARSSGSPSARPSARAEESHEASWEATVRRPSATEPSPGSQRRADPWAR